jgi:demethylmenaquinone methyltransferase/2-methoxy-6-polyprenyl-1,4-benzoquinol methylase
MTPTPIPPHPRLEQYYRTQADRPQMVRDLFDDGAPYYEWVCRAMSFGSGEWYRGRVLANAGLSAGSRLLDVATGTGLVLRSGRALCGPTGLAIGLDPSRGMLRQCQATVPTCLVQGTGERLPLADRSFDMVSMGYALRHVSDLRLLFDEFRRVLSVRSRSSCSASPSPRW